jgi:hypothetical protein
MESKLREGVTHMKKIVLALAMVALLTTTAFGQIVIGVTGNQYVFEGEYGSLPSLTSSFNDLQEGRGTYWGLFAEIILGKLGIGAAFNYQDVPDFSYEDDFYSEMWSYDANFYLSYHMLGGRAFLDPFIQAGLGMNAYDFADDTMKNEFNSMGPDDPLFASAYWDFGAGLGVNIGTVGVFVKGAYMIPMEGALIGETWPDEYGYTYEYDIMPWYLNGDFKWTFGLKLIL